MENAENGYDTKQTASSFNSAKQFNKRMTNVTKGLHEVVMGSPDRPLLSANLLEDI